jgi:hypothetical protein
VQPDIRLSVFATCLALTACGGEADTGQAGGSAGGTAAGGAGGATAGAGGAGGATAGAGGTVTDAGKDARGRCAYTTDCLPTEKCVGGVVLSCPDGALCVLPPRLGTCSPKTPVTCATKADCETNEQCVQVMFPILAIPPDDAGNLPKLGECRPATQAARAAPPSSRDNAWWGAVESAMRKS